MTEVKKTTKKAVPAKAAAKKELAKKVTTPKAETKAASAKKVAAAPKATPVKVEAKVVAKAAAKPAVKKAPRTKNTDATYATGKRKNATAKVWLKKGTGKITVNGKPVDEYLKRAILEVVINQPFGKTETEGKFDIDCQALGGGLSGQAGAIKHAIAVALQLLNPDLRAPLKKAGFLTRDSRVVERKKAGLKKARKGQVFQKR